MICPRCGAGEDETRLMTNYGVMVTQSAGPTNRLPEPLTHFLTQTEKTPAMGKYSLKCPFRRGKLTISSKIEALKKVQTCQEL